VAQTQAPASVANAAGTNAGRPDYLDGIATERAERPAVLSSQLVAQLTNG
jgi:hypothetical protein